MKECDSDKPQYTVSSVEDKVCIESNGRFLLDTKEAVSFAMYILQCTSIAMERGDIQFEYHLPQEFFQPEDVYGPRCDCGRCKNVRDKEKLDLPYDPMIESQSIEGIEDE